MQCRCLRSVLLRAALATALLGGGTALAEGGSRKVDVEHVLGIDVSCSMDHKEQLIQREGYSRAFRSKDVIDANLNDGYQRIAVTHFEWGGSTSQTTIVPWTPIDSAASAQRFSDAIRAREPLKLLRTSISGAIDCARVRFRSNGDAGVRRVIDISGDGPNNYGRPVVDARNEAIATGITINGLLLMTNGLKSYAENHGEFSLQNLAEYHSNCVIGGSQAFMIPVRSWDKVPVALRRKLVQEIAGFPEKTGDQSPFPVVRVRAKPRFNCRRVAARIGADNWKQRRLMWSGDGHRLAGEVR